MSVFELDPENHETDCKTASKLALIVADWLAHRGTAEPLDIQKASAEYERHKAEYFSDKETNRKKRIAEAAAREAPPPTPTEKPPTTKTHVVGIQQR